MRLQDLARGVAVSFFVLAIGACSGPGPSGDAASTAPAEPSSTVDTPATSLTSDPADTSASPLPDPTTVGEPPALGLEEVAAGLAAPINITATPDGWLLVNERGGRVIAVDPASGETEVSLDITDRVRGEGEQGLLGLALHPEWPDESRAFVHYTDRDGNTVLSEFGVGDLPLPPRLDAATERVLLSVDQPYSNHNGGQLAFGPDGYLYMALGDGGSGGDPHGHGQDPHSLLGSILRIDVDGSGPGDAPYAIPPDNPFPDGAGGAPEVFLYGLRNPWRFSFDRESGLLWIGDVGQNATEEIDRVDPASEAGANLGWNVMEGSGCSQAPGCDQEGLTVPVAEYGRDRGCSVTGGYVYRGDAIEGLDGWYIFSDYCTGVLFGVASDADGVADPQVLLETGASVSTLGEDASGELYLADIGSGAIYRLVGGD